MPSSLDGRLILAVAVAAMASLHQAGRAESLAVFGTGVGSDGALLPDGAVDPHYRLIAYPGQVGGAPAPAFVFDQLPPDYLPNGPRSKWISPRSPFGNSPAGSYTYRTTFELAGFDPVTAVLQGGIASDNEAAVFLNGVDTGVRTQNIGYLRLRPFTLRTGFVPGVNTLDIRVLNDPFVSFNPTALRVDLQGTAVAIPEPASVALAGLGLAAPAAWLARRRRARR